MPEEVYRVFISAVSREFRELRARVANELRRRGLEVKVQEDFRQEGGTLLEKLKDYIGRCDAVICLAGDAHGAEPEGEAVPQGEPRRSYTQREFEYAWERRANGEDVPVYVYFKDGVENVGNPVTQGEEEAALQAAFVERVRGTGIDWDTIESADRLVIKVLQQDWPDLGRRVISNLPVSIGTLFKGREEWLERLRGALAREGAHAAAVTAPKAIHGLGGIGKTRLAVEFGHRHAAEYSALFFLSADSPESLRSSLAALTGPMVLNLPEYGATEEEIRVAAALRWLEAHPGWFLIVDNVDTEAAAAAVEDLIGRLRGGDVVITSRLANWSGSVEPLDLEVLDADASAAFLEERTGSRRRVMESDAEDVAALVAELDGLALALEQAGAYIFTKRISYAEYRKRWREKCAAVMEWFDARQMHYPQSVAVTWETTFAQLSEAGRALLNVLAQLAPEPIPRSMFEGERAEAIFAEIMEDGGDANADLEEALAELDGFCLVRFDEENADAFRVHRVVQEIVRLREHAETRELTPQDGALRFMAVLAPSGGQDIVTWERWEAIAEHVEHVLDSAGDRDQRPGAPFLLEGYAQFLATRNGAYSEAEPLYRRAAEGLERILGPDHPDTKAVNANWERCRRAMEEGEG